MPTDNKMLAAISDDVLRAECARRWPQALKQKQELIELRLQVSLLRDRAIIAEGALARTRSMFNQERGLGIEKLSLSEPDNSHWVLPEDLLADDV